MQLCHTCFSRASGWPWVAGVHGGGNRAGAVGAIFGGSSFGNNALPLLLIRVHYLLVDLSSPKLT